VGGRLGLGEDDECSLRVRAHPAPSAPRLLLSWSLGLDEAMSCRPEGSGERSTRATRAMRARPAQPRANRSHPLWMTTPGVRVGRIVKSWGLQTGDTIEGVSVR